MTADEWLSLKVGDWIHDVVAGRDRQILTVKRHKIRRGSRWPGRVATSVTVDSIKSPGHPVVIFDIMDGRGGRYRLGRSTECATT